MQIIDLQNTKPVTEKQEKSFEAFAERILGSGNSCRSICLTSGVRGAGKSFVSYHLAKAIAEKGKRVLLIDADVLHTRMYKEIGYEEDCVGLTHVLNRYNKPVEAIYATTTDNLYLMPAGNVQDAATAFADDYFFRKIVQGMLKVMEYVILDAPSLQGSDYINEIIRAGSSVALVIADGEEARKEARGNVERLKSSDSRFLGVILNRKGE